MKIIIFFFSPFSQFSGCLQWRRRQIKLCLYLNGVKNQIKKPSPSFQFKSSLQEGGGGTAEIRGRVSRLIRGETQPHSPYIYVYKNLQQPTAVSATETETMYSWMWFIIILYTQTYRTQRERKKKVVLEAASCPSSSILSWKQHPVLAAAYCPRSSILS